jgi:radical SAM protein with 4Fe4S-binding SPASM domain
MRRETPHVIQLKRLYSREDGRLQGEAGWKKLPFFWFLLFLSYRCTRRCAYCYSFNQVGDDNTTEMDDRTFARLAEWIPEVWRANNVKVNCIGFLGGEPLLRTDRIKRVMDAVYRGTDGMQGYVYTNGDVIESVNWDDLEDIQWITTNITDIGIDELSRRMQIIGARSNVINQTVIATLDDLNLERILDIARFGIEHGYRLRFHRDLYRGLDAEYKHRLLTKYHQVCDLLERYALGGYEVHTTFLFDTLIPLWDLESSPYPCGRRVATVFPDGGIGPCIRDHEFRTGTIFDPDPMSRIDCDTFHYGDSLPAECGACESRTTCQGGCPHDKLLLTGTRSGRSVMCDIHREIIPRLRYLETLGKGTASSRGDQ